MFAYYSSCPNWLNSYMLNVVEVDTSLDTYLIPQSEIYSLIIETIVR